MRRFWKTKCDEITGSMQRSWKSFLYCWQHHFFFFAFYYHLCCFDVAARRQTFDEYPLFWFEKIDSHERDNRPQEHRAVFVTKKQRDAHSFFLPSAVSMATHRCKSKKTRKREKMHLWFVSWVLFVNKDCGFIQIVSNSGVCGPEDSGVKGN